MSFSVHMLVNDPGLIDAVDDNFAVVGVDFLGAVSRCFLQSLSELLQLFFTVSE